MGYVHPRPRVWDYFTVRNGLAVVIGELWHFYLYSSLFLATAAAGMACVSCLLQELDFSLTTAAVLSLVVFSVYNQNRKTDIKEDSLNHGERFCITSRYSKFLYIGALVAYALAFFSSAFHGFPALVTCSIPLFCGLFYSLPLLPGRFGYRRLKEVPVVKNLVVSFSWAFSFSLIPVAFLGAVPGTRTLVVFLFIFSWTFIASILPDIRDCAGDAAAGIRTIPVIIGTKKTGQVLTVFNILFGLFIFVLGRDLLGRPGILTVVASLAYSQGCILLVNRGWDTNFTCDVLSDGQFIIIALTGLFLRFCVFPTPLSFCL